MLCRFKSISRIKYTFSATVNTSFGISFCVFFSRFCASTFKSSFENRGISFPAGAAIVYDESIGRLIVTNTPENLQKIESIIKEMNIVDPQVLIQTKFVEIKLNDLEELGFKYNFSRQNSNVSKLTQSDLIAWESGTDQFLGDKYYNVYLINYK